MSEFPPGSSPTTLPEFEHFEQTIAALVADGQLAEARRRLSRLAAPAETDDPPSELIRLLGVILHGEVELHAGNHAAARPQLETGLALLRDTALPPVHAARLHHARAAIESAAGNDRAAGEAWAAAAEAAHEHGNSRLEILFRHNHSLCLRDQLRIEEAEGQLLQAIDCAQNNFEDDDPLIPTLLDALGVLYHGSGHPAASIDVFEEALRCARSSRRTDEAEVMRIGNNLASALFAAERPDEAIARLDQLVALLPQQPEVDGALAASIVDNAIDAHAWRGDEDHAAELRQRRAQLVEGR